MWLALFYVDNLLVLSLTECKPDVIVRKIYNKINCFGKILIMYWGLYIELRSLNVTN